MSSLFRLDELASMIKVKIQFNKQTLDLKDDQEDLKFCYTILKDVSRSFASVIIQLHPELRDAVCIFYLVLRGLDTVEDDMSIPIPTKQEVLPKFHENLLLADYHVDGIGKGQERVLLEEFYRVNREYMKLKPEYQAVISDICHRMAMGMTHFLTNEVQTKKDYDLYCHYVAGLVGHGLTRLFAVSGLEDPSVGDNLEIANSMGLFLQKTNIIRDYLEDISEEPPRIFWPREIWSNFTDDLHNFKKPEHEHQALECLNAMVADALQHVPHCIEFMSKLQDPTVFLFCAIPQVMAIATLSLLYNNGDVFKDKVKIRKGLACKIICNSVNLEVALGQFNFHCKELEGKLNEEDPTYDISKQALIGAKRLNAQYLTKVQKPSVARNFLLQYPALGGRLLYNIIDSVGGRIMKR